MLACIDLRCPREQRWRFWPDPVPVPERGMSFSLFDAQSSSGDTVVALATVRERHRLSRCRQRIEGVIEHNRRAMEALFGSGQLFTRSGSKVGRELLLTHQKLLRLTDQLGHAEKDQGAGPLSAGEVAALMNDVERLLEKSSDLARRNRALFSSLPGR